MPPLPARSRLIVALDAPNAEDARALTRKIGDAVEFYKIGMELGYAPGGLAFAEELIQSGKKVFLDFKLHDIGATVERATRRIAGFGASFLTVHGYPQTMAAAHAGASGSALKILAVTVMTSYNDADLAEAGYGLSVAALVERRARQAQAARMDGLILSPHETAQIRAAIGEKLLLVTPGVRPAGVSANDQKRAATPADAISAGADYLVVGRPITQAQDPHGAANDIVAEIARAAG